MSNTHACTPQDQAAHPKRFTEGKLDNDLILHKLELAPGQVVMDVGCGAGYMAKLFSPAVGDAGTVYAVDISTHFIEQLRQQTRGTNIQALVCDIAETTPIPAASVDRIFLATVLHAQRRDKLPGIIQEFQRLLKPEGMLAIVEFAKVETPFGPPLAQRYSPEELCQALPFAPMDTVAVAEFFYLQRFHARAAQV